MGRDQEFLEAARNGNITLVEKILNQRTKRNGPLASLRRGPGINIQDSGGYSALHYSSLNGHADIVRLLLFHEASPNLLDSRGSSALHLASWAGHQEIVKMLLTYPFKPANPDLQTIENETPLHCAAQHGHTGALTTLLAHGANPNICNSRNETPLDLAAQYGRVQVVQMLIRAHPELLEPYSFQRHSYSTPSYANNRVTTHSPLHLASRNGHNTVVEILLAAGVDVNFLTPSGSALHEAALCGKEIVVRTLLEAGADLNATDSESRTPLDVLQEFPPHVTKGIISVINGFRTKYEDNMSEGCRLESTVGGGSEKCGGMLGKGADSHYQDSLSGGQFHGNNYSTISPSASTNSFEQAFIHSNAAALPLCRAYDSFEDYDKQAGSIKLQRTAPKKPPRRNLSISPTHMQNIFPNNNLENLIPTPDAFKSLQKGNSNDYHNDSEVDPLAESHSNENLVNSSKLDGACHALDSQLLPAPRKFKNPSNSFDVSALKSYNPHRKLKRNKGNCFNDGRFNITICGNKQQQPLLHGHPPRPNWDGYSPSSQENVMQLEAACQNFDYNSEAVPQIFRPPCPSFYDSSPSISSGVSFSDRSVSTDFIEPAGDELSTEAVKKYGISNINNRKKCNEHHRFGILGMRRSEVEKAKLSITSDSESDTSKEEVSRRKLRKGAVFKNKQSSSSNFKNPPPVEELRRKPADAVKNTDSKLPETKASLKALNFNIEFAELNLNDEHDILSKLLEEHGLRHLENTLYQNGYDNYKFMNGIFDEMDLSIINVSKTDADNLISFMKTLPYIQFTSVTVETSLENWLKSIRLLKYTDNFKKHLYNNLQSVCGVWEIELKTVLEINKVGHRKRILHSLSHLRQAVDHKNKSPNSQKNDTCAESAQILKGTGKRKKSRPAPKPPITALEIRAPTELLIGLPSNLYIKWPHSATSLISQFLKYEVYYLGSTVVKEFRGTESTRRSIQKLKGLRDTPNLSSNRSTNSQNNKVDTDTQDKPSLVQLSISYKGVEFIDMKTNGTIFEHEIRNINCACQDADDMSHFAYITTDRSLNTHSCHVFNVDSMHLAMEIMLTLAESFEVAYQMALRNTTPLNSNTANLAKPHWPTNVTSS